MTDPSFHRQATLVAVTVTAVATLIGVGFAIWPQLSWQLGLQDTRVEVSIDYGLDQPVALSVDQGLATLSLPVLLHFDVYNGSGSPLSINDALAVPYESDAYGVVDIAPTSIGPNSHARLSAEWSFWFFVDMPMTTLIECGEFRFIDRDADGRMRFVGVPSQAFVACLRRYGRDPAVVRDPDNSSLATRGQSSNRMDQCREWSVIHDATFQPDDHILSKLPNDDSATECDCVHIQSFGESFLFNRDTGDRLQTQLIAIDLTRAYSVGRC